MRRWVFLEDSPVDAARAGPRTPDGAASTRGPGVAAGRHSNPRSFRGVGYTADSGRSDSAADGTHLNNKQQHNYAHLFFVCQ